MNDILAQRLRASLHATALPSAPEALHARLGDLAASQAKSRRMPLLSPSRPLALLGIAALLAAALAAAAIGSRPPEAVAPTQPEAVISAYLQALVAGDCTAASALTNPIVIGQWNHALCGGATHVTAFRMRGSSPGTRPNEVTFTTYLTTTGTAAGLPPGEVVVGFVLQRQSSGVWRVVAVFAGGPILPSPVPSPFDPWTATGFWPSEVAPPGFEARIRTRCGPMFSVPNFAGLPLELTDYRSDHGTTTYSAAIFSSDTWTAACVAQTGPGGTTGGVGGGAASGARWVPGEGSVVGHAGLSLVFGGRAVYTLDWNTAMGVAPPGATTIRMVIGDLVSDAVIADGLFSVAWQAPNPPTALIAWDAQGNEIDRIDESALAQIFNPYAVASPGATP